MFAGQPVRGLFLSRHGLIGRDGIIDTMRLFSGLIMVGLGFVLAYSNYPEWYSAFAVGLYFIILPNKLSWRDFLKKYFIYFICGVGVELVGRGLFGLWSYPRFDFVDELIHVYAISYPFAFLYLYEFFKITRKYLMKPTLAFSVTFLFNAFLHEVPNIYGQQLVYNIPFVTQGILGVNIVVILGWSILVGVSIAGDRLTILRRR